MMTTKIKEIAVFFAAIFALIAVALFASKSSAPTAQFLAELCAFATMLSAMIGIIFTCVEAQND